MFKLVALDTETTGLSYSKHAMVQLSGYIIEDRKIIDKFDFKIRPFDDAEIDDKALEVNHLTIEELSSYPTMEDMLPKIKDYFYQFVSHEDPFDLLTPMGFNVDFDYGFLRNYFQRLDALNSFKNIFARRRLDCMSLAMTYLDFIGKAQMMESFSQINCAKALGIEIDTSKSHEAAFDADICWQMYNLILGKFMH